MTLSQKQNQNFTAIVWHRGGVTCMSKMDPLNRPGHAVSLLRDVFFCLLTRKSRYLAFGVRIWRFLCEIVAKPGQNLNATGDAGQCKPKHLFSLWDSSATFGSGVG